MKCAIMQPTFNPWMGLFDMIDKVDVFVFYDDVQLVRRSWQVRNKIYSPNGELFLTIPIQKGKRDETMINAAIPDYSSNWVDQHLKSIKNSYSKSKFFTETFDMISSVYNIKHADLASFNEGLINVICEKIGITTPRIKSSSLSNLQGVKDERLCSVCKAINADHYLSATGSAAYIEASTPGGCFPENEITLEYLHYKHPIYPQNNKGTFVSYLGIFDLLFNVGFEKSLSTIREGRQSDYGYMEYRKIMQTIH